ncbi:hypothetical protein A9264_05680 [Vibrio sp. UCD-FRSSP16_10]|uniref:hypothetical protein n=1 Tax=unclassified Vibrio TaxID=2614977 RepID=UPI0007FF3FF4|nr:MULTISPECIES: hypothetical protein [unclassified Vibrio]OBT07956.1 hypothetical protein A9260_07920 [Vibrio sp. UCD-FRSSP16_30]OBT17131.1 hypothetical protein A9264_05680 [Vibrio sp. UCD-FRSSP16_10]
MTISISDVEQLQQAKIQWLVSQIDVDFPTRESVLGKACYLDLIDNAIPAQPLLTENIDINAVSKLTWMKVDFHKLTVLYAHFVANHVNIAEQSKEYLQEFLAQIILDNQSDDEGTHTLCVGFLGSELVATCIVSIEQQTQQQIQQEQLLISDLLMDSDVDISTELSSILYLFDFDTKRLSSLQIHMSQIDYKS